VEVAVAVKADWVEATVLDHGPARPPSSRLAEDDTEALGTHGRGPVAAASASYLPLKRSDWKGC
jgi:hypothetical protein